MQTLFLLCLLYSIYTVSGYPSAPGTCNMNKMATLGHGPSQSTCEDCYGVEISTDSPHLVNIQLTGRSQYQGIVILVKDKYTNKTLGEFQDYDQDILTSVACDDDEDEQDKIEPDTIAVLGHIDAKWKNWPVNVGWNMEATKPLTELKVVGMVVIDYENFHLLPETYFKIKRKIVEKTLITSTPSIPTAAATQIMKDEETKTRVTTATHTVLQVEHEAGTFVHQESNILFMVVLSIMLILYILLSICYRQFTSRRLRMNKSISSMLQQEDISLVVCNPKES